jgi:hypothetical protein
MPRWSAVRDQLAANTSRHQSNAAESSLLAGTLVDARCPSRATYYIHAVKKGRRYRYYVSAAPVTGAGTDLVQGWAGMPPAREMPSAPRQLRLVPIADFGYVGGSRGHWK